VSKSETIRSEAMDSPTAVVNPMGRLPATSGFTLGLIIIGDYFPVVVSHPWVLPLLCGGRS
jgi:hypothetical protein